MSKIIVTTPPCMVCHKTSTMEVDAAAYTRWQTDRRVLIQDAFPELPADLREQLKTGTHPACWDQMFGDLDDED